MNPPAAAQFRALHERGCFVLPNAWDIGSAKLLAHLGFKALATTSAGLAFSRGRPDAVGALDRDAVLEHLREMVAATPLPVNADFQDGYGADADAVAESVARCVATGVAGLSIEDATGQPDAPLWPRAAAIHRVRAARSAIDASGSPVVLTARCEAHLVGVEGAHRVVLDRLVAYAEAGADCLYAPGVTEPARVAELVRAVAPLPVNVLVGAAGTGLNVAHLADLGVRRVSVGSALARLAYGAVLRAGRALLEDGSFEALHGAASFRELDEVFSGA